MSPDMPGEVRSDRFGNTFKLRSVSCPTCGPDRGYDVIGIRGGPTHHKGLGIENRIVRCRGCSLYFANPFPFPQDPQSLYGDPEAYFASHCLARKVAKDRQLIRSFKRLIGRARISLLDVGSGRGEMLAAARAEGLSMVVGLELSRAMIESARLNFGVEVLEQEVEVYSASAKHQFDVIVLNAILEHVYDPDSMISACGRLLSPGGLLYIDVPNEDHLLALVGATVNRIRMHPAVLVLSPSFPPYHVYGFSPRSLRALLSKHGFHAEFICVRGAVNPLSLESARDLFVSLVTSVLNLIGNALGMGSNLFVVARSSKSTTCQGNQ